MLHIHCGDSSADKLRTVLPEANIIVWSELLFDGPLLADVPAEQFIRRRAEFLSGTMGGVISVEKCMAKLYRQENDLEKYKIHDEIYLWFDACMYDQFIMIRLLHYFNSAEISSKKLGLICIGDFPGIDRFIGLGQLDAAQLLALREMAVALTASDLEYASRAWKTLCSSDPQDIVNFSNEKPSVFPYLQEAFKRLMQQYPSRGNGLNRFENEILRALSEGLEKPSEIFKRVSSFEAHPFFGDTYMWHVIKNLALLKNPLLKIEGPGELPSWNPEGIDRWSISITESGIKILSCSADNIQLNGIDKWLAGVHLTTDKLFRYN